MKLALILILFLFSQNIFAQECPLNLSTQFCKTPAPWKLFVSEQSTHIHKKSLKHIPNGKIIEASHQDYINYLEEFEHLVEIDLGLSKKDLTNIFAEVKESLLIAVQNDKALNEQTKQNMVARLNLSQYLRASEFAKIANPKDAAYALLMSCGFGLQYDNAFTFTDNGWVVVCPARLVRIASVSKADRLIIAVRGLAHELGHQIDSASFPDAYTNLKTCAQSRLTKLKSPLETYMAELTADFWAAGSVLNIVNSNVNPTNKFIQVELAYKDVCGLSDTPPQLSGVDRINFGLSAHPDFSTLNICIAQINSCEL